MNTKIVIDPGHGGEDSGAVGNGIVEKDFNLKISQYIANRLKELGADVFLTRTTDETLTPNQRTNRVLNAFGNNKDVLVISNHINAGGGDGAEVIYALRGTDVLPNLIVENLEQSGQNIRKIYQRRLPSNPSKDYYFMHRNTGDTESLIVEYGFLDSTKDDVTQLKSNWQNYAEAVVKAIADYKKLPYSLNDQSETIYTVKSGDSLWNIAKKFNTRVENIKQLNNLNNNLLAIGQKLIISQPDSNNLLYTVKSGDTLYKIAQENNTTVKELMDLNNLLTNMLTIGQKLLLPPSEAMYDIYIVKSGDTLYSIAKKLNTSIEKLISINNLTNNQIKPNQQLSIPKRKQYIVQAGDTLYKIAQKFNKTIDDIISINNLTNNILTIGQVLNI